MGRKIIWKALILLGIISNCLANDPSGSETCASLYTNAKMSGVELRLSNGAMHPNLGGEELPSGALWNVTTSVDVSPGCILHACSESHLQGTCMTIRKGAPSLPNELDNILSANCICPPKTCDCTDQMNMRKKTCGRAYINRGGCSACDPTYTDLKEGTVFAFPRELEDRVSSIMVRPGCSLTLYELNDLEGESQTIEGIRQRWVNVVRSYECKCNDIEYEMPTTPRPTTYPKEINIPLGLRELLSLRKTEELENHPGIHAALKSMKGRRSSKNAYLLLLGTTGAGKSSTINHLFDNPNMTRVGSLESTTDKIYEFRVPVPVNELGILNSELRVIDTPGLGDTKGTESDAQFLASLEEFLSSHEELNSKIPNVLLVVHKFSDNRFSGPKSQFVRMLRCLDTMRDKLTDASFSNVVFVFTHFMSEAYEVTSNPREKLQQFKTVIEANTGFPQPIVLAVAENKAENYGLLMINGYSKLPNGEYYAKNLLDAISRVTLGGGDPIGDAVVRSAFRNPDELQVTSKEMPLVPSNHSRVPHFLNFLTELTFDADSTEISEKLSIAADSMPERLKQEFPEALAYLQNAFNLKNIVTLDKLPRSGAETIRLLSTLRHNEATAYLLETALKISPPEFPDKTVAGYSYDVFHDRHLSTTPFLLGNLTTSEIGYKFPQLLRVTSSAETKNIIKFFRTKEEFVTERLQTLGISGNIPISKFFGWKRPGWNILKTSDEATTSSSKSSPLTSITALREFRTFKLSLPAKYSYTDEFINTIGSLGSLDQSNETSVNLWRAFFYEYGTHVVKSVHGGGSVEVQVSFDPKTSSSSQILESVASYFRFLDDLSIGFAANHSIVSLPDVHQTLRFTGGDSSIVSEDLTRIPLEDAVDRFYRWKESIQTDPVILESELQLVPLSVIVRRLGLKESSAVERATQLLFESTLKYTPLTRTTPPPPRQSISTKVESFFSDILDELMKMGRYVLKQVTEIIPQIIVPLVNAIANSAGYSGLPAYN